MIDLPLKNKTLWQKEIVIMEKSKEVKTKVEPVKVDGKPKPERKPFTKAMQANPKGVGKVASLKPVIKPVEKPKVEAPPVVIEPPVEQKAQEIPPKPADGVAKWLSGVDALTPADFAKIAANLASEIDILNKDVAELKETIALKRKPPVNGNGRVQIKDTKTGKIYPSKNGTYKALLKSGELAELVKQGAFGDEPDHNSFGWYALNRGFPGRFEEIKSGEAPCK